VTDGTLPEITSLVEKSEFILRDKE